MGTIGGLRWIYNDAVPEYAVRGASGRWHAGPDLASLAAEVGRIDGP